MITVYSISVILKLINMSGFIIHNLELSIKNLFKLLSTKNEMSIFLRSHEQYLLNQVLHRLYDYFVTDIRYMFDHDNPILRLADNDVMQEEYFIAKEEITW